MRPPDDLSTLKHLPLAMGTTGALVLPAMWAFVLGTQPLLPLSVVLGVVFLAYGLYIKYRARYSPREALWAAVMALLFFGSLLVASTTSLAWRAERPDLQPLALALAAFMGIGGMSIGFIAERRRLRVIDARTGLPAPLVPILDLKQHRLLPWPPPPPPRIGTVAMLAAIFLNLPLLLQVRGWNANDIVWLIMPALGATVTMLLASGFGPGLARAIALLDIERRIGRRLVTSRLEELQALRKGFWLSRLLAQLAFVPSASIMPVIPTKGETLFPALAAFMGCWFHQDFDIHGDTLEAVVSACVAESDAAFLQSIIQDIDRFLETGEDGMEERFQEYFLPNIIPTGFRPTTRDFLLAVRHELIIGLERGN